MGYEQFKVLLSRAGYNYGDDAASNAYVGFELGLKQNIKDLDADDLIEAVEARGHDVDRSSDIDDFSDEELLEALSVPHDDTDWQEMYTQIMCGNEDQAIENFKQIIQEKTGRIIV